MELWKPLYKSFPSAMTYRNFASLSSFRSVAISQLKPSLNQLPKSSNINFIQPSFANLSGQKHAQLSLRFAHSSALSFNLPAHFSGSLLGSSLRNSFLRSGLSKRTLTSKTRPSVTKQKVRQVSSRRSFHSSLTTSTGLTLTGITVLVCALSFVIFPYLFKNTPLKFFNKRPDLLVYALAAINVAVFLAWRSPSPLVLGYLNKYFVLDGVNTGYFHYLQALGSAFSHQNFTHLLFNMVATVSFGLSLCPYLGPANYLALYLSSAMASSWASAIFQTARSLGASGAAFGIVGCFSYLFPTSVISLFFVPLGAWNAFLLSTVGNVAGVWFKWGGIDYLGHLGGSLIGVLAGRYFASKRSARRRRRW